MPSVRNPSVQLCFTFAPADWRHAYEIEYVDRGGRIREILIDASDGKVLSEEEESRHAPAARAAVAAPPGFSAS